MYMRFVTGSKKHTSLSRNLSRAVIGRESDIFVTSTNQIELPKINKMSDRNCLTIMHAISICNDFESLFQKKSRTLTKCTGRQVFTASCRLPS